MINKGIPFLYFVLLCIFHLSCNAQVETDRASCIDEAFDKKVERTISFSIATIDPSGLKSMGEDVVIIDTREEEEYNVSHIPNAHFISYKNFSEEDLPSMAKDSKIVLYCSIGYRSEKIGEKLKKLGYPNVYNLYGSIFEWVNQGNEVVNKDGQNTNKVHTYNKNWSKWLDENQAERVW